MEAIDAIEQGVTASEKERLLRVGLNMEEVKGKIERVESEIEEVKSEIEEVKSEIEEVKSKIESAKAEKAEEEWQRLSRREELLRKREELLRKREEQLRDEKLLLLVRQSPLIEGLKRKRDEEPGDESSRSPRGLKPAPQALADFWRKLRNAKLMEGEKVLQLVGGTSFLGDPTLRNKLMVRECYMTLEKKLEKDFGEGQRGRFIVGTPGIGTSMFGFWLLYKWACNEERVVVVKDNLFVDAAILLCPGGAFKLDNDQLDVERANPQTKFLVDAVATTKSGLPLGQLVMVTSPKRDRYKEAIKRYGYCDYYMNVWTLEELEECRALMYDQLEVCGVKDRWDKWGGVPRYVLEKIEDGDQKGIWKAIERSSIDMVNQTLGASSSGDEISDLLLHIKVEADFRSARMDWASAWVAERVAHKAWQKEKEKLIEFIGVSTELPAFGTLRGKLWEGLCHDRLAEGGTFNIRALVGEEVKELNLPPCSSRHTFPSLDEVSGMNENVYCRPRATNLAAIDSLRQPGALYQITVAERHDIDCAGLEKALAVMQSRPKVCFYFVVPQQHFMSFTKQVVRGGVGRTNLANVEQYALEMKYSDLREKKEGLERS